MTVWVLTIWLASNIALGVTIRDRGEVILPTQEVCLATARAILATSQIDWDGILLPGDCHAESRSE